MVLIISPTQRLHHNPAFQVEAHGLTLGVVAVAEWQRFRRVNAGAVAALETLATTHGAAIRGLIFCRFTMGISAHADSLQHNFDLDIPA